MILSLTQSVYAGAFDGIKKFLWGKEYGIEHYESGRKFYENKEFKKAHEEFKKAYEYLPKENSVLLSLGQTSFHTGDYNQAAKYIAEALENKPKSGDIAHAQFVLGLVHAGKSQNEKDPKKQYVYLERSEKLFMGALQALGGREEVTRNHILENLDTIHAHLNLLQKKFPKSERNRKDGPQNFIENNDFIKGCRDFTLSKKDQKTFDEEKLNFLVLSLDRDDPFGLESILDKTIPDCHETNVENPSQLLELEARVYNLYRAFDSVEGIKLKELIELIEELEALAGNINTDADKILFSTIFTQTLYLQGQLNRKMAKALADSNPTKARELIEKTLNHIIKPIYALASSKFGIQREGDQKSLDRLAINYPSAYKILAQAPIFTNSSENSLTDIQVQVKKKSENYFGVAINKFDQADILLNFKTYEIGLSPDAQKQFEKFGQVLFNFSVDINDQVESDCVQLEKLFYLSTTTPEVRFEDVLLENLKDVDSITPPDYFGSKTYQVNTSAVLKANSILDEVNDKRNKDKGNRFNFPNTFKSIDLSDLDVDLNSLVDKITSVESISARNDKEKDDYLKSIRDIFTKGIKTKFPYQQSIVNDLSAFLFSKFEEMPIVKLNEYLTQLQKEEFNLEYLIGKAIEEGFSLEEKVKSDAVKKNSLVNVYYMQKIVESKEKEEVLNYLLTNSLNLTDFEARDSDFFENIDKILVNYTSGIDYENQIVKLKELISNLLITKVSSLPLDSEASQFDQKKSRSSIDRMLEELNVGISINQSNNNYDFDNSVTAGKKNDREGTGTPQLIGRYSSLKPILFSVSTGLKLRENKTVSNDTSAPEDPKRSVIKDPDDIITLRSSIGSRGQLMTPHDSLIKKVRLSDGTDVTDEAIASYDKYQKVIMLPQYIGMEVVADFYGSTQSSLNDYKKYDERIKSYYLDSVDKKVNIELRPELQTFIEELKLELSRPSTVKSKAQIEEEVVKKLESWLKNNFKYSKGKTSYEIYSEFARESEKNPNLSVLNTLLKSGIGDCDVQNSLFIHLLNNELGIPARLPIGFAGNDGEIRSNAGHGWSEVWLESSRGWKKFDATSIFNIDANAKPQEAPSNNSKKKESVFSYFSKETSQKVGMNELQCYMKFFEENIKVKGAPLFFVEKLEISNIPCKLSEILGTKDKGPFEALELLDLLELRIVNSQSLDYKEIRKSINKHKMKMLSLSYEIHNLKTNPDLKIRHVTAREFLDTILHDMEEDDLDDYFLALESLSSFTHFNTFYRRIGLKSFLAEKNIDSKIKVEVKQKYYDLLKGKVENIDKELRLGVEYSVEYYKRKVSDIFLILNNVETSLSLDSFEDPDRQKLVTLYSSLYKKIFKHALKNKNLTWEEKQSINEIVFNTSAQEYFNSNNSLIDQEIYQDMKEEFLSTTKDYYFSKIRNRESLPPFYFQLAFTSNSAFRYDLYNLAAKEKITKLNFKGKDAFDTYSNKSFFKDFESISEMKLLLQDIPAEDLLNLYRDDAKDDLNSFLQVHLLTNLKFSDQKRSQMMQSFVPSGRKVLINDSRSELDWLPFAVRTSFDDDKFYYTEGNSTKLEGFDELIADYLKPENRDYLLRRVNDVDTYFKNIMLINDDKEFKTALFSLLDQGVDADSILKNIKFYNEPRLKKYIPEIVARLFTDPKYTAVNNFLDNFDQDLDISAKIFYTNILDAIYKSDSADLEKYIEKIPLEKITRILEHFKPYSNQLIFNSIGDEIILRKEYIAENKKAKGRIFLNNSLKVILSSMGDAGYINDQYFELFDWVNIQSQNDEELRLKDEPLSLLQSMKIIRNNVNAKKDLFAKIEYRTSKGNKANINVEELFKNNLSQWKKYLDSHESSNFLNDYPNTLNQMLDIYQTLDLREDKDRWLGYIKEFYIQSRSHLPQSIVEMVPAIFNKYLYSINNSKDLNDFLEEEVRFLINGLDISAKEIVFRTLLAQESEAGRSRNYEFIIDQIFKDDNYRAISRVNGEEKGPISQLEFAISQTIAEVITSASIDHLLVEEDFQRRTQLQKIPVMLSADLKSTTNIILYNENIQSQALLDSSLQRINKEEKTDTEYTFKGKIVFSNGVKVRIISESIRNGLISPSVALSLFDDGKISVNDLSEKEREDFKVSLMIGVAKISMIRSLGETFINKETGLESRNYVPPAQFDSLPNAQKYQLLREGNIPLDKTYFINLKKRFEAYGLDISPYYTDLQLKTHRVIGAKDI